MRAVAVPDFPRRKPPAYIRLRDEPSFSPARHLALTPPQKTTSLAELGYAESEIRACPSPLALTSAFRIFSDEGAAVMSELAARMKSNRNEAAGTGANRLGSYIRGAGYRSKFVRDFCECREWIDFLSALAGAPLARHSVPAVACGLNYAPEDVSRAVDTWHVDSVAFDVVILLTDPRAFTGGAFQYFRGAKAEGEALLGGRGEAGTAADLPPDRVVAVDFPAAGWGFMQQGNKVFHRACRLLAPAERVTMIPSLVALTPDKADGTNIETMSAWGDPGILTELARHEAWRARGELSRLIDSLPLSASPNRIATALESAVAGVNDYARRMRAKSGN